MGSDEAETRTVPPSASVPAAAVQPGTLIGPYRLGAFLGAGGMGRVYRATDTRLDRDVAIKFVAEQFSHRAARAARAIAALNHPHICTLYDLGADHLIMEMLEGETLSARLRRGPLPFALVALHGCEIAEALAEAHAAGIVHRDLKPGNVMVTRHGVKVLDFGLARLIGDDARTATQTGAVMGTFFYMSPEQLRVGDVTARADLFAFGLILYEMATGRLPFPGASLGNMLVSDGALTVPPPSRLTPGLPDAFDRLVLELLQADPAGRPARADLVRDRLAALEERRPLPKARVAWASIAAALALLGATLLGWWWYARPAPSDPLLGPVVGVAPFTTFAGREEDPSLSPDAASVVFSAAIDDQRNRDLYVMPMSGGSPTRLTRDAQDDEFPLWSPDGTRIAFVRRPPGTYVGGVFVMAADGSGERRIAEIALSQETANPRPVLAWSPDSQSLVFPSFVPTAGQWGLYRVSLLDGLAGLVVTPTPGTLGDLAPALSPDGTRLAFNRCQDLARCQLVVQKLSAGWRPEGEVRVIGGTISQLPTAPAWMAFSSRGPQLLFLDGAREMQWSEANDATVIHVSETRLRSLTAALTRDGTPRVLGARAVSDSDIWTIPLREGGMAAEGAPSLLLRSTASDGLPAFSPDGRHLLFSSTRSGSSEAWLANADGSGPQQLTRLGARILGFPRWSRDGRRIAFHARVPDAAQLYVLAFNDGTAAAPTRITNHAAGFFSPDWLSGDALVANGPGGVLYRLRPDGTGIERLFEGTDPLAAPDGRRLLYRKLSRRGIFARDLAGDPATNAEARLVEDSPAPPVGGIAVVPGGFYYVSVDANGTQRAFNFYDDARLASVMVAPVPGLVSQIAVSPDRRHLAFGYTSTYDSDLVELQFGTRPRQ